MKAVIVLLSLMLFMNNRLLAQEAEIQQLLLNVEKLAQLKKILSDMKEGFTIISKGYNTVRDITKGNFKLHDNFLAALLEVSPSVKKYKRVGDIISAEIMIVKECKAAAVRFKSSNLFAMTELRYMESVYGNLLKRSVQNLDELAVVITAGKLRMNDDERLAAIDRVYLQITDKLIFLRDFNAQGNVLAVQRAREMKDSRQLGKLNGL